MRLPLPFLLGLVLLGLAAGCQSHGPSFDPRQSTLDTYATQLRREYFPGATNLNEPTFSAVQLTNQVRPEWLKPPTDFFRLGPGDGIEIEMLGEPATRSTATLGPDGKIYYNLLPGTFVWGLTLTETKDLLEKELTKYIRVKPEIIITLRAVGSTRVWIAGNVGSPGVYPMTTPMSLLEAVTLAGGPVTVPGSTEETVDFENSFVMRNGQMVSVNFYQLLRRGDLSQNIYLRPDDFVYLRPAIPRNIYILGAVPAPSALPYPGEASLVWAIASAGGTLPYAYLSHVAIIRGSLTSPRIGIVDYRPIIKGRMPDIPLLPGDIVYVPFAPYARLAVFADQILHQFVQTIAVNEGTRAVIENAPPVTPSIPIGVSGAAAP